MKTSNKILSGLAVLLCAGLLASNARLKSEYESRRAGATPLDGFAFAEAAPFSHVRINSASSGVRFVVRRGGRSAVQVGREFRHLVRSSVRHDTLVLEMPRTTPAASPRAGHEPVAAYIDVPAAAGITCQDGLAYIDGLRGGHLRVACANSSRVTLRDFRLDTLTAATTGRAVFQVEMTAVYTDKGIGHLYATQRDSSRILLGGTRLHGAVE